MESVLTKRKAHQQGGKDNIGKENIPISITKEHSIGEDKEKERGKDAQRQNLAHAIIPAATATITPVPPTSDAQSVEEQALVSVIGNNFSFDLYLYLHISMADILLACSKINRVCVDLLHAFIVC